MLQGNAMVQATLAAMFERSMLQTHTPRPAPAVRRKKRPNKLLDSRN
jgi:hypothetical protein